MALGELTIRVAFQVGPHMMNPLRAIYFGSAVAIGACKGALMAFRIVRLPDWMGGTCSTCGQRLRVRREETYRGMAFVETDLSRHADCPYCDESVEVTPI